MFHCAATGNDYIAMRIAAISRKPCFIQTNLLFKYFLFDFCSLVLQALQPYSLLSEHNPVSFFLSLSFDAREDTNPLVLRGASRCPGVSDWFPATSQPRLLDSTSNSARNRVTKPWATAWRGIRLNYCPAGSFVYSGIHYPAIEQRGNFRAQFVSPALAHALCNRESSTPSRSRPPIPDARPTLVINNFPFRRISRSLNRDIRSGASSIIVPFSTSYVSPGSKTTMRQRAFWLLLASKSRHKVGQFSYNLAKIVDSW